MKMCVQGKIVGIIQARLGSTRLPGKVLREVKGKPLLQHMIERLSASKYLSKIIIATSTSPVDDALQRFSEKYNYLYYRGSETDVLDRFYKAAIQFGADMVVRFCSDCPIIDPYYVDKVIEVFLEKRDSFCLVCNKMPFTFPDGFDVEICDMATLEKIWNNAKKRTEREHVFLYLYAHPERFPILNVEYEGEELFHTHRFTLDYEEDFTCIKQVIESLYDENPLFGLEDVLTLTRKKPAILELNKMHLPDKSVSFAIDAGHSPVDNRTIEANKGDTEMNIVPKPRVFTNSKKMWSRAKEIIPAGTQTFSKGTNQFVFGVAPIYLDRGSGCYVWDVDNNRYLDLCMGLWPIILGYGYPEVAEAISSQSRAGQTFSLMHPLEIEVSEILLEMNPWAEMVRFGKNGSDVTTAAVKVSRAFTGRDMVVRCSSSYHGWHDWYLCTTERTKGIPSFNKKLCKVFDYNDIDGFRAVMEKYGSDVACVIMEGVVLTPPQQGFLESVEKITHSHGSLLVFDEIINGFRLSIGGATEYFNINVDLATMGKGIANGLPVSALLGKQEVMRLFDEVFFSCTFGGETIGLAACKATLEVVKHKNVLQHLWKVGKQLHDGLRERAHHFGLSQIVVPKGYPVRTVLQFYSPNDPQETDLNVKSLFQQEVLKRGVLLAEYHALSLSHTEKDIAYILDVYEDSLNILKEAIETDTVIKRLEGVPVQPVLRRPG